MSHPIYKTLFVLACALQLVSTAALAAKKHKAHGGDTSATSLSASPAPVVPAPVTEPTHSDSTAAHLEDYPLNEVEAGANARLTFQSAANSFTGNLGYSRFMNDLFQATASTDFATIGGSTAFNVLLGPTFNHPLDHTGLRNALYARAQAGVAYQNVGGSFANLVATNGTSLGYRLEGGKRFELLHQFTFKPAIRLDGTTASGTSPSFLLIPIQLSLLF
jgi:hypothetical protein